MKNTIVCENIDMNLSEFERMLLLIKIINCNQEESPENTLDELINLIINSDSVTQ